MAKWKNLKEFVFTNSKCIAKWTICVQIYINAMWEYVFQRSWRLWLNVNILQNEWKNFPIRYHFTSKILLLKHPKPVLNQTNLIIGGGLVDSTSLLRAAKCTASRTNKAAVIFHTGHWADVKEDINYSNEMNESFQHDSSVKLHQD